MAEEVKPPIMKFTAPLSANDFEIIQSILNAYGAVDIKVITNPPLTKDGKTQSTQEIREDGTGKAGEKP